MRCQVAAGTRATFNHQHSTISVGRGAAAARYPAW